MNILYVLYGLAFIAIFLGVTYPMVIKPEEKNKDVKHIAFKKRASTISAFVNSHSKRKRKS